MISTQRIKNLLLKAGLKEAEAALYLFVMDHPGCQIGDAVRELPWGKSSLYRSLEDLKDQGLVHVDNSNWKQRLYPGSLQQLIENLANEQRKKRRLIANLKAVDSNRSFLPKLRDRGVEYLDKEETFERYMQLAESDWSHMLAFGNWEDLNVKTNIVSIEKKFIENRLKKGGKALVAVTKGGDNTSEIIDYESDLDLAEERRSTLIEKLNMKAFWANVFEGNDYVHIWNLDERGEIESTFYESKSLAEFYRSFIYSNLV